MTTLQPLPSAQEPMTGADGKLTQRWRAWMQRADVLLAALDAAVTGASNQPLDATLTALAGLATGASKVPYSTGTDTFGQLDLDTDGTLAANSDTRLATQKAVKTYADSSAAGRQPIPTGSAGFGVGSAAFLEYTDTSALTNGSTTTSVKHAVLGSASHSTDPQRAIAGAGGSPGGTWRNDTGATLDANSPSNGSFGVFTRTA